MGSVPPLLSFLLMIAAGWVYRHQLIVIEFLQAENRLLKDRLRGKRIRFTDAERALLARKAKALDRDTKYTDQFRRLICGSGTNVIRLPPRSPNLNAYAERFVRSIKFECLNRMIFIGHASLRRAVAEYVDHYHGERNHQGLDNRLIRAVPSSVQEVGMVRRNQRLGGMLNFYYREAA